jgi:type IV pilus assembly protein PilQ
MLKNAELRVLILSSLLLSCRLFFCGALSAQPPSVDAGASASGNITLDFKDADIRNVLKIISYKSGTNIVTTPDVIGNVTIRLNDVPWERALDAILQTYGYGYEKKSNIIFVAPIDKLTAQKKQQVELAQVQPTVSHVYMLKYLDAQDAKKALEPQLSPRGKITVLEMTGQAGWEFGSDALGKRKRVSEEKLGRSKTLIISDIPPVLDKIDEVIAQIDVLPQQIMIQTRIVEVSRDTLRDLGIDIGTGTTGATDPSVNTHTGSSTYGLGGHNLSSQVSPSVSIRLPAR